MCVAWSTLPFGFNVEYALLTQCCSQLCVENKTILVAPKKKKEYVAIRKELCTAGMINSMHTVINSVHLSASNKDSAQCFLSICYSTSDGDCDHFSNKREPGTSVSTLAVSHSLQLAVPRSSPELDGSGWCEEVADQKSGKEEAR